MAGEHSSANGPKSAQSSRCPGAWAIAAPMFRPSTTRTDPHGRLPRSPRFGRRPRFRSVAATRSPSINNPPQRRGPRAGWRCISPGGYGSGDSRRRLCSWERWGEGSSPTKVRRDHSGLAAVGKNLERENAGVKRPTAICESRPHIRDARSGRPRPLSSPRAGWNSAENRQGVDSTRSRELLDERLDVLGLVEGDGEGPEYAFTGRG
jgi:hypothetical protein